MTSKFVDQLDLKAPANRDVVQAAILDIAVELEISEEDIPKDWLSLFERGDGGTGAFEDRWIRLNGLGSGDVLETSIGYLFVEEKWLHIGSNGEDIGYGINFSVSPPEFLACSYIELEPVYMGLTFDTFLEAVATGEAPLRKGEEFTGDSSAGGSGQTAEWKMPRGFSMFPHMLDEKFLLTRNRKDELHRVDIETGKAEKMTHDLSQPYDRLDCQVADISRDGSKLAYGAIEHIGHGRKARVIGAVLDIGSGKVEQRFEMPTAKLRTIMGIWFSPDQTEIRVQTTGGKMHFWSLSRQEFTRSFPIASDPGTVYSVSTDSPATCSPDGSRIAICDFMGSVVRIYDCATGAETQVIPGRAKFAGRAESAIWSPDGTRLAVASRGLPLRLIDTSGPSLSLVAEWPGLEKDDITSLGMTPDGGLLISIGRGARIWRVSDGSLLDYFPVEARNWAISPSGEQLCLWDRERKLMRIFRLPSQDTSSLGTS